MRVRHSIGSGESRADFVHKYSIALKEARETLFWLRLAGRNRMAAETQLQEMRAECDEIISVLVAIIKKAKSS